MTDFATLQRLAGAYETAAEARGEHIHTSDRERRQRLGALLAGRRNELHAALREAVDERERILGAARRLVDACEAFGSGVPESVRAKAAHLREAIRGS